MSILGYVYLPDVAGTDTELGTLTTPAILPESPVSVMMTSDDPSRLPDDWYRQKAFGDTGCGFDDKGCSLCDTGNRYGNNHEPYD